MDVKDAAYRLVHDYPGGASSLGPRLGKRGTSLSAEVNPQGSGFAKFGLLDAMDCMAMSGDHRVLHAMAAELGYMTLPLPVMPEGEVSDEALQAASRLADVAREFGDVMAAASASLADQRITDNEMAAVEQQWGELVARGQQLLALFKRLNAKHKPGGAQ